jgi:hypothetical protein
MREVQLVLNTIITASADKAICGEIGCMEFSVENQLSS